MRAIIRVITFALGTSAPVLFSAQVPSGSEPSSRKVARNEASTAQDQSNAPEDLKLTQAIRPGLMKDAALTTAAKNIQMITIEGKVTLRGAVTTPEEKNRVLEVAGKHADVAHLADHLEIKARP
jgi:osmotically-inducible protein OsmY